MMLLRTMTASSSSSSLVVHHTPSLLWNNIHTISHRTNQFAAFLPTIRRRQPSASVRLYATSSSSSSSISTDININFVLSNRLNGLDQPTVWQEFSPLSVQHGSINLGQGFPDWEPPMFVKQCMYDAIYTDNMNQYARSYAHMPLAISLAEEYTTRFQQTADRYQQQQQQITTIDPATMIATAVGCTNVLFCALQGLLNPQDEVICLEPSFDIYISQVKMAGGVPVFVPLRDPGTSVTSHNQLEYANDKFVLDMEELEAAITSRTKVLLLNTPHNPTGKMFTQDELMQIATIVKKYPHITVISDEVYEHIVFQEDHDNDTENNADNALEHISIASLPGMFDRTITLSSSGKTFSCTGWKVGWAVGPPHLIQAITAVQQWVNFSAPTPNQHAIAKALQIARQEQYTHTDGTIYTNYYQWLQRDYQRKRQLLIQALQAAGMKPIIPHGGFFIMAETKNVQFPYDDDYKYQITDAMPKVRDDDTDSSSIRMPRDWAMSRWLTEVVGVTAIPPSAFYSLDRVGLASNYLRFAFCKSDDTIVQAHERFNTYFTTNDNSEPLN